MRFLLGVAVAIVLATASASAARAAEPARPRHDLGGGLALGLLQARDDVLVPLRWMGPSAGITGGYRLIAERWDVEARAGASFGAMADPNGTWGAIGTARLSARAYVDAASLSPGRLRLGAALGARELLLYPASWDDDHLYWLGTTWLGPTVQLVTPPRRQREVVLEATLPVVALVSRPPRYTRSKGDDMVDLGFWLGRFADSPEPASFDRLFSVAARASLRGTQPGFRLDPWVAVELDTFSRPERVTHLALWVGLEARSAWGAR